MSKLEHLPNWPLLMDIATLCRFTSCTRAQVNALIAAALLPPGREMPPGCIRWHRHEVESRLARLWELETGELHDEHGKAAARRALEAFKPGVAPDRGPRK